jgi:hypothetical protein
MPRSPGSRAGAALGALALLALAAAVPASADEPAPLHLDAADRASLKQGMRRYLESIAAITEGLAANQMAKVVAAAKRSGNVMLAEVSPALVMQVPPAFSLMSADTHQKFDDLARYAETSPGRTAILKRLGDILGNCTGCHSAYRFADR